MLYGPPLSLYWYTDWCTNLCPALPYPSTSAATSSRQKAGMSGTTRPQTRFPSRKAGLSTLCLLMGNFFRS
jgi:hypothetical protein